jgi:uncharacterized protein
MHSDARHVNPRPFDVAHAVVYACVSTILLVGPLVAGAAPAMAQSFRTRVESEELPLFSLSHLSTPDTKPAGPAKLPPTGTRSVFGAVLMAPVMIHRTLTSPQDGDPCTFHPSCSEFAVRALRRYGVLGWPIASDRLLRCHPSNIADYAIVNGRKYDPVPTSIRSTLHTGRAIRGGVISIVPGLGQVTAGKMSDGLYTFATVVGLALGGLYYARRGQNTKAWITLGFASGFYLGGLYGGVAAHGEVRPGVLPDAL